MTAKGFDHDLYIQLQSRYILERVKGWDKLYLEFGGKLTLDLHAKRCLPGYKPNAKLQLLQTLKDQAEIIICVHAGDIERNKIRGDFGTTYGQEVLRLIDDLRGRGLVVNSVLFTRYQGQPGTKTFAQKLENRGVRTYKHRSIPGYPLDVDAIVSDQGYGSNCWIETTRPIVVVTGPGPGSGKLATCLSQLYHESQRGVRAGYAKFETFPVWNIPLKHPLNVAYEAATADLKDLNIIDSFHLEAHGESAVSYNRDLEMFPVVRRIIETITGQESCYKSPTDMGVNQIAFAITDDQVVREASRQEIIRRYFKTAGDVKRGEADADTLHRMKILMQSQQLRPEDRPCVEPARQYRDQVLARPGQAKEVSTVAIQLEDGAIITGRNSALMTAPAAALLNAIKHLGGLPDAMHLLPPIIIEPIQNLKGKTFDLKDQVLCCEEILMALAISAVTNPVAQTAMEQLPRLDGAQAHATTFVLGTDEALYSRLRMNLTWDSQFLTDSLFAQ